MSYRRNGSIIGVDNAPTATTAPGIWHVRDVSDFLKAGIWPVPAITFANPANPAISGANSTTHTFSSVSLGSDGANRVVVIAIGYSTSGVSSNVTDVTVAGGGTRSEVVELEQGASSDRAIASIWMVTGVTATSGDVVVTISAANGSNRGLGIAVYNLLGASATVPTGNFIASGGADSGTALVAVDVDTVAGGVIVGAGGSIVGGSHTWAGATETNDNSTGNTVASAAGNAVVTGETPRSVDANTNATGKHAFACASFQPA